MAIAAYLFVTTFGALILLSLLFSPHRETIAASLQGAQGAVTAIFSAQVIIVLGYLGISGAEKTFGKGAS
jgi:hypothetical protein